MFTEVQHEAPGMAPRLPNRRNSIVTAVTYPFYFTDPDGNVIQALYEPTISRWN